MITPSFGLTATERVLPRLALDFTTASLDSRVTFARSLDTATAVNSSGFIAGVLADTPRFDYNPITLACKGLLIEESRANLLLQSQSFQTTWTATACTVDDDATDGPDGLLTADKIIPDVGTNVSVSAASVLVRQDITKAAAATTYTYSIFAKADGFDGIRLFVRDNAVSGNNAVASFSLSSGSVSVAAAAAGTFTNASATAGVLYANGFYRFSLTFTTGTETIVRILAIPSNTTAAIGDGVKGIYVFGAQLEAGAFATSYIPTTTTSLTRNADVATMTGTNFSDWYNQAEGSFYFSAQIFGASASRNLFYASNGASADSIALRYASGSQAQYLVTVGGMAQVSIATSGSSSFNTTYRQVCSYKQNDFAHAINGVQKGTSTSGTIPTVDQLIFGNNPTVSAPMTCGWIQEFNYWPQKLTNAEVTAFSK